MLKIMETREHARTNKKDRSNFKQKNKDSKAKHLGKLSSNSNLPIRYRRNKRKLDIDNELKNLDASIKLPNVSSNKNKFIGLNVKRKIGSKKKRKIGNNTSTTINNELKSRGM